MHSQVELHVLLSYCEFIRMYNLGIKMDYKIHINFSAQAVVVTVFNTFSVAKPLIPIHFCQSNS